MYGLYVQLNLLLQIGVSNLFYGQPELGPFAAEAPHVAPFSIHVFFLRVISFKV